MKFKILLGALLISFSSYAQTIQQLKDSAANFPPMPKGSADLIPFVQGLPTFGSGTPFSDIEYTVINVDYIDGENGGSDIFIPVNPSDQFPGANTVKVIKCALNTDLNENYQAANRDKIVLGTTENANPFFLRGSDNIDNDYVSILHFDFENGAIQLKGSPTDYNLIFCDSLADSVQTTGWYLFYTANNNIDLVAFIFPCDMIEPGISGNPPQNLNPLCNNTNSLNLNNPNQFQFTQAPNTAISIPQAIAQIGTNGKEIIAGMTVDFENSSYLFGHTDGNISGNNASKSKVFVSKILSNGVIAWTYDLNVKQGTLLMDAITDSTHIYICGRTLGQIPGFTNAGKWDGIILKLNLLNGQLIASDQWGNAGIDGYGNIEFDNAGNLFVSGQGSPANAQGTDNLYLVAKHSKANLSNIWRTLNPTTAVGFNSSAEAWGGLTFKSSGSGGQGKLVAAGWYMAAGGANAFLSVYENLHTTMPTRPYSIIINSAGGQRADWILDNVIDNQGNIYVAGYTTGNMQGSHLGQGDCFITKYSPQLTNPITKQFGTNKSDMIRKMEIDTSNNVYTVGYTYGNYNNHFNNDTSLMTGDILIQKFDSNLNYLSSKQIGTPTEDRAFFTLKNDVLFIGGMTEGNVKTISNGSFDGYLLALNSSDLSYNSSPILSLIESKLGSLTYYPNPTTGTLSFGIENNKQYSFAVINQLGQQVQIGVVNQNNQTISLSSLTNGIYFIRLLSDNTNMTFKVIKN
jgi:hypothetical protein